MFCSYGLPLKIIRTDYKSGLQVLLKERSPPKQSSLVPETVIRMRLVNNNIFSPSSPDWPPIHEGEPYLGLVLQRCLIWSFPINLQGTLLLAAYITLF
ncbi:unnamed protein product [Urochloa humidicola]